MAAITIAAFLFLPLNFNNSNFFDFEASKYMSVKIGSRSMARLV